MPSIGDIFSGMGVGEGISVGGGSVGVDVGGSGAGVVVAGSTVTGGGVPLEADWQAFKRMVSARSNVSLFIYPLY
jgi:hypothetical protein